MSLSAKIGSLAKELEDLEQAAIDLENKADNDDDDDGKCWSDSDEDDGRIEYDGDVITRLSSAIRTGDRAEAEYQLDKLVSGHDLARNDVELGRFGGRARA